MESSNYVCLVDIYFQVHHTQCDIHICFEKIKCNDLIKKTAIVD